MSPGVDRIRCSVAAHGLPDGSPMPSRALDDTTWARALAAVVRDRTTGLLLGAVVEGALPASASQIDELLDAHEQALARDLLVERMLVRTVDALDAAGVPTRVLKGAAVAHGVYPDPGLRSFGDADVLVPGRCFDDAVAVLLRRGGRRRYSQPRPGFDRRFGKGVCVEQPDGMEVDVHRAFVAGPFGLSMDPDELFSTSTPFELGGRTMLGLDRDARFVHACFHAVLGGATPRFATLRDVAEMLLHTGLGTDRVLDFGRRWRCTIVLQRAITLTERTLGLRLTSTVVDAVRAERPSKREHRALDAYAGPGRGYARQALAGLRAVRGPRAKLAYASALLVPTRAHLRKHDGGQARRFARVARTLRSARARR